MDCPAPDSPPVRRRRAKFGNAGLPCPARWNPYVVAWWAAAFPGLGHLLLSRYVRGLVFSVWEIAANSLAHINQAMAYTFCGRCDDAREVLPLVLRPDGEPSACGRVSAAALPGAGASGSCRKWSSSCSARTTGMMTSGASCSASAPCPSAGLRDRRLPKRDARPDELNKTFISHDIPLTLPI